jgi:hypothetical protein
LIDLGRHQQSNTNKPGGDTGLLGDPMIVQIRAVDPKIERKWLETQSAAPARMTGSRRGKDLIEVIVDK